MTRSLTALALIASAPVAFAQNLVADPGLEDTLKCPQTIGRFYHPTNTDQQYIAHWRATTLASPDLHHTCGYSGFMPRTGEGYAGIIIYDPTEYREYITALLTQPLQAGICYYVEFHVALSAGSTVAVDEFQVHFSNGVPLSMAFPPPGPLPLMAHLQAAGAPTATTYQKISGLYNAVGGETAMTFGNFRNNANTTLTQVSSVGQVQSYYFIDDVSVMRLDLGADQAICGNETATVASNIQSDQLTYTWSTGNSGYSVTTSDQGAIWLDVTGNGTCTATDTVLITIGPGGNAGGDATSTECASIPPASLQELLTPDADTDGTFYHQGVTTSVALLTEPGNYDLVYVVDGDVDCASDTALLSVVVHAPPVAGNDTSVVVCVDAGVVDLFGLLGGADAGGTWTAPSGSVHDGTLDPALDLGGAYTYYVQGLSPCPDDQASVTVAIEPCSGLAEHGTILPTLTWLGRSAEGMHRFTGWPSLAPITDAMVMDATGRKIAIHLKQEGRIMALPFTGRTAGIYFLQVVHPGGTTTVRFLHDGH